MVKEEAKKKLSKTEVEEKLIDNFISLQKVLTNLTITFDVSIGCAVKVNS